MKSTVIATLAFAAAIFTSTMAHGQDDHGDTRSAATPVAFPSETLGRLNPGTDDDYFRFTLSAQTAVVIETLDTWTEGWLYDSAGTQLAYNDDGGYVNNFRIAQTLSAGTYYVRVGADGTPPPASTRCAFFEAMPTTATRAKPPLPLPFPVERRASSILAPKATTLASRCRSQRPSQSKRRAQQIRKALFTTQAVRKWLSTTTAALT